MKILLITHFFPPLNTSAALRPYSWAKYWTKFGHSVTVLTTKKYSSHGVLNFNITSELFSDIRIHEINYGFFRLQNKNSCLFEGSNLREPKIQRAKYLVRDIYFKYCGFLLERRLLWICPAVQHALGLAKECPFDIMVSTFSPGASHWIGRTLKRRWAIPWVADFRDPWADNPAAPGVWPFSALVLKLEKAAVSDADLLTTVSEPWRLQLARKHKKHVVTVENGFDNDEFENLDTANFYPEDGKLRFVYAGAIYPGKRDPSPLFAAIRELMIAGKLHRESVELFFYGNKPLGIREMSVHYRLEDIVKIPGQLDRASVLRAQRDADGLIFLDWQDPTQESPLSGKVYEYLRAGKPILGIGGTTDSAPSRLIEKAGTGYPLGKDINKIARFLTENFIDKKAPLVFPNWNLINSFDRKVLARKALNHMQKLINT